MRSHLTSSLTRPEPPMNTVRDLLDRSESPARAVRPSATLVDCARIMMDQDAGALLVLENEELRGLVSWHDVLAVVADRYEDLNAEHVSTVMSTDLTTADPDDDLQNVEATMVEKEIHHVPVTEDGEVLGMISQQTIVRDRLQLMSAVNKQLSDYIREHYQKGLTTGHRLYESSL